MTDSEFKEIGDYLTQLWPAFSLTLAQAEIWKECLAAYKPDNVKAAMRDAYKTSRWKEPQLPDVLDALKDRTRTDVAPRKEMTQDEVFKLYEADRAAKAAYLATQGIEVANIAPLNAMDKDTLKDLLKK